MEVRGEARILAAGSTPAHTEERVVSTKIRYAVLCYGMPLKIAPPEIPDTSGDKITKPEFRREEAAVDWSWRLPLVKMNVPLESSAAQSAL